MNKKIAFLITLVMIFTLTSCSRQVGWVGLNYGNKIDASYHLFDGKKVERIQIDAGDTFTLMYAIEVNDGSLKLQLNDPNRQQVWEATFLDDTEDMLTFRAEISGRYNLNIIGDQTKGGFELQWESLD